MIIVRLEGGLGNQMFQYAAARRLAVVNATQLKLDLGWFSDIPSGDTQRQFELPSFNCEQEVASPEEVKALRGIDTKRWPKMLKSLLKSTGLVPKRTYIREKQFHFDPEILQLQGDVYLDGYWQSEKYFLDASDTIRKDFTLSTDFGPRDKEVAGSIRSCQSVSLHVRRGDYVTSRIVSQQHGSSQLHYYQEAIAQMSARLGNPHFFVFSDDPEWVKTNLQVGVPMTYLDHNGPEKACEDLRLMSLCQHHIIANSSFSWWGAWLSSHQSKIVMAPKRWFNRDDIVTDDLIPQGWLRL
jgi:hypothetical protein